MDRDEVSDDVSELRREAVFQRRYRRRLAAHPDPRDPDYPGPTDDEADAAEAQKQPA